MRLYFLRHGIAEDRQPGHPDSARRLTPEGVEEMERVAAGMKALGLQFDAIRSSPYARAAETARIVAKGLDAEARLEIVERLASGCDFADLRAALNDVIGNVHVLLVGHEPDFSEFVAILTGGHVRMKKAGLACVDVDVVAPSRGVLRWLINPEQLGRIR